MQRAELVSLFVELRTSEPVIVGPGLTSGALYQADDRPPTIYNMDMGYATAICLGLALAVPGERVVALEGDGSMLANLGVLSTIGRYAPANLVVVVLHNGVYGSCGDGRVETGAATTDLVGVARGPAPGSWWPRSKRPIAGRAPDPCPVTTWWRRRSSSSAR